MSVEYKKYKSYKTENWDEFLKEIEVNVIVRKIVQHLTSNEQLTKEDDGSYALQITSTFKNQTLKFIPGVSFLQDTMDGRTNINTVITFVGNKMIQMEDGEKPVKIIREFNGDDLVATCTCGDVVSTKYYKAIE